ncbi:ABC transporter permease [Caproiciproducens sp. R1]|uniref:ABC transporter permease n=1 Tax=Caproiciproducens sp. R1 TaxID=3435000 RepID=UPI0040344B8D|nr:ABC transporter permease [Oscillospiraceae bacterium]
MDTAIQVKKQKSISKYAIYIVLLALTAFFSIVAEGFFTTTNFFNILRQVAVYGIPAVGMTMVIITGGIDISVGSMMGAASVGCASLMVAGLNPILAMLIVLIVGLIVGLLNGFFTYEVGIPPMIVTLAAMSILRGLAYIISGGLPVYGFPASFTALGQGYLGPIPIPVIIMAICFAVGYITLEKTSFGRYVYGIGSNREASRLSGVSVRKVMYSVYGLCGMLAALAGMVLLSRVNSGQPKAGEMYEMDIITAVVLGGVSTTGGEGKITRVIAGLLVMGVLLNGMILMNIPDYYQRVVKGAVLLLAISADMMSQKRLSKKI